jgi:sarcosine oxidase subunit beta
MGSEKPDIIIIGSGIIGAAIAFEASKRGWKTLNIDKLAVAGYGSTGNTCAIIRTHYSTWEGTAIAYESFFYWKNWREYLEVDDEMGLAELRHTGMLVIRTKGQDLSKHLEIHDRLGIPYEKWDLETLKQKAPLLDDHSYWPPRRPDDPRFDQTPAEHVIGGLFIPTAGYINDAKLSVHNLQRAAEAKGARFRFNEEVVDIRKADGRVAGVTLEGGEQIDSAVVVNAAGPHSFLINRMAGVEEDMKIKTRALRHEVHFVPAPKEYDTKRDGYVMSDDDIGGYSRPEAGNLILLGSQDPSCDPQEWIEDPDEFNRQVTTEQWQAQVYRLAKRVPSLPIPNQPKGIVDLYDVTDDWIPIYDKSSLKGFYMAVGTSGNQYKNAPVVGQLMTALIDACEQGQDHDKDPVTMKTHHTGVTLNVGFFSRLREINRGSSFSVLG